MEPLKYPISPEVVELNNLVQHKREITAKIADLGISGDHSPQAHARYVQLVQQFNTLAYRLGSLQLPSF
jgi:hypothetical protein